MGGPAASVLLTKRLKGGNEIKFRDDLNRIANNNSNETINLDQFHIVDTAPVGGNYKGQGLPFSFAAGLQNDWEPGQLERIGEAFGIQIEDEILICACCSHQENHQILAELCIHWAQHFGGIVDFGGALIPRSSLRETGTSSISLFECDWIRVKPYFLEMVAGMPGRIMGFDYKTASGRNWVFHVADTSFVRAWMNHPEFHMVK